MEPWQIWFLADKYTVYLFLLWRLRDARRDSFVGFGKLLTCIYTTLLSYIIYRFDVSNVYTSNIKIYNNNSRYWQHVLNILYHYYIVLLLSITIDSGNFWWWCWWWWWWRIPRNRRNVRLVWLYTHEHSHIYDYMYIYIHVFYVLILSFIVWPLLGERKYQRVEFLPVECVPF